MTRSGNNRRPRLRTASFFSGIGGFDLGFAKAKYEITIQCETDPFCNAILEKHWPDVRRYEDIRELKNGDIPFSDVWTAGFPCQDLSLARMGRRDGLKGKKSGLFYEFARLLRKGRPRIVVIENVPGLLSSHRGRDFEIVIRALADVGYGVAWRVLNSKDFGVPQSRQRVFIVGSYRDWRSAAEILFEPQRRKGDTEENRPNGEKPVSPFKESVGDPLKGPVVQRLAYCLYACSARHTGTDWSRTYISYPAGRVRRLTPAECERIQGFPKDWTLPPDPCSDTEELDTLRYKTLGNAVTVNVAQWLAGRVRNSLAKGAAATELKRSLATRVIAEAHPTMRV